MNLGNIYQNTNFNVNNGQKTCYCKKTMNNETNNINDKINSIFNTNTYINRIKVSITTKNQTFNTIIIGKTSSKLISLDNMLINIKDIVDIKKID